MLTYHVVPATVYSAGVMPGEVKTVEGDSIMIKKDENGKDIHFFRRVVHLNFTNQFGDFHSGILFIF